VRVRGWHRGPYKAGPAVPRKLAWNIAACKEGTQPLIPQGSIVPEKKTFWIRCEPHNPRHSPIGAGGFSAYFGQRIRNRQVEQAWDSVVIHGDEEPDGTLAIRVLITNPAWINSLQIACIRSRPDDVQSQTALECDLDHVSISRAAP
jgi:hypothetical protein